VIKFQNQDHFWPQAFQIRVMPPVLPAPTPEEDEAGFMQEM
jgi:hypothetical protein